MQKKTGLHVWCTQLAMVLVLEMLGTPMCLAIDYKDAPKLEPFRLTKMLVEELATVNTANGGKGQFLMKGIDIVAEEGRYDVSIKVSADRRMNMWRGRPNDLMSAHMGSLQIEVYGMEDQAGNQVFDKSREKPWDAKITFYHIGEQRFEGSRRVSFNKPDKASSIQSVTGALVFRLPIDITKYEITHTGKGLQEFMQRSDIKSARIDNGLYIDHPVATPDFDITLMGFDATGKRISIVSMGTAGSAKDNHWYHFSTEDVPETMLVFVPEEFIEMTVPFSINL